MNSTNDLATGAETQDRDWADMSGNDHFVQLYSDDKQIVDAVAAYFVHGLRFGETCIIVATGERNRAIESTMRRLYQGTDAALKARRFIVLDADETLTKFMIDGMPDAAAFDEYVGGLIRSAAKKKTSVRVFGEMVAVLTSRLNTAAAIELERLWNKLAESLRFRLFCAYPQHTLQQAGNAAFLGDIVSTHCHVIAAA